MDHDHQFPLQTLETKRRPIIGARRHFAAKEDISSESDEDEDTFLAGERQKVSISEKKQQQPFPQTNKSGLEAEIERRENYALESVDQATSLSEKPCVVHLDGIAKQTTAATLKEALGGRDSVIAINVFSSEENISKGISVFRNEKLAQDAVRRLSTEPVDGNYISATVGKGEANKDSIFSGQQKELRKKKEEEEKNASADRLSTLDRAKLEWLLTRMSCEKGSIASVLCFSINHIDKYKEVSKAIVQELLKNEEVNDGRMNDKSILEKGDKKLGLLYVINDLLFNGISGVSLVWRYRVGLEPYVPSIFDNLYAFSRRLGGRLKMDIFCKKVAQVIEIWRVWVAFPEEVLDSAWQMFKSKEITASVRSSARPLYASKNNRWATAAAEMEEEQDDQEYNGSPVNVLELLLEREEHQHRDSQPSNTSTPAAPSTPEDAGDVKSKFKPSFTKGTFVSRKMRMHAEDLF
ncbi:U2-associated protein [Schizosaccharomyces cryophilus OY26]|uniref:U2-associated protein n=1 Tax=Schizosaccharomyces cryophilus (strain OY26 / ATCC MYA-4695 / CBS 11777 / NBRC 106824 / NRRL Y48691) TaxID=653667 RepID=S9VWN8_SCHCR|nr:U2-associated protein [Schizosaccharomyces cryophilus OY26]EPY50659.1 U2-associated protein [Schizosaccharomyces cryophilus OY26]